MERKLTICFTSDIHGHYSAVDYTTGEYVATGLSCCAASFVDDGDALIIDGGDTLQGSPFTYWLYKKTEKGARVSAKIMNLAGYDFVTLGNHDFNYGKCVLEAYLAELDACCLCANVSGIRGLKKTAVITLKNGLKVGLTGVTSHYLNKWESAEKLAGITVTDAFTAAASAYNSLKRMDVDLTICIYHGGFENDVSSGAIISETEENQGFRICKELNFDVLLTGHQHQALENLCLYGTFTCQTPHKGRQYVRMQVTVSTEGKVSAQSNLITASSSPLECLADYLAPLDQENAYFLAKPIGTLDIPLMPTSHLEMAENGSCLANFFNQVQLDASGADISATCLGNEIKGFDRNVTLRDVAATYIFPNTLKTIIVDRGVLKAALERSAEYFALNEEGMLCINEKFLYPVVQHYNYDYVSGLEVTIDVRRPIGERVISMIYHGEELEIGRKLKMCLNDYRASGSGGYSCYAQCKVVQDQPTEISQLITEYIERHKMINVDRTKWLHVKY